MIRCARMKTLILSLALMLGLSCSVLPQVQADDMEPAKTKVKKAKKKTGLSPVAQALDEAGYFTETEARPKAKFYIFICSASWCGPCRQLMPQIVEEYEKNIKKNKSVSMVLLGCDRTPEEAKEYIEHYETDMPGVLNKTFRMPNRPQSSSIPSSFILNAKGEVIASGHGNLVLNWKSEIKKKPQKPSRKKQ